MVNAKIQNFLDALKEALEKDPRNREGKIIAVVPGPSPAHIDITIEDKNGNTVTYCVNCISETWEVVYVT